MTDYISIEDQNTFPPVENASVLGFVKHVYCEGARFHVLSWDSYGHKCSVQNCIMNQKRPDCKVEQNT